MALIAAAYCQVLLKDLRRCHHGIRFHDKPIAANVLERRFDGWQLNQAWVGDITYIPTGEGWLYLACVMDLEPRQVQKG